MLDPNSDLTTHRPIAEREPGYIFIAGLPRTGTNLLRSLLNSSDEVGISMGEAHYFGGPRFFGLLTRRSSQETLTQGGDLSTEAEVRKLVDHIYRQRQNNFWGAIPKNAERDLFLQQLLASNQRERALFELAMIYGANGKPLRGEKTPANIYAVPMLLEWFPGAKIIHTVRDPRAVYVSEKKKYEQRKLPFFSALLRQAGLIFDLYSSLDLIFNWRRIAQLHLRYQQDYPDQYYLSRYEDLISEPELHLRKICAFLDIEFNDAMLQQTFTNSSFLPRNQMQGFDTSALDRWRQNIPPLLNNWFKFWCKEQLLEFGYQP